MKLKIEIYDCLCATSVFKINGKDAYSTDFGSQGDISPEDAEEYACGNMQFITKEPTEEILKKYSISEKEYREIAEELSEKLSFGSCGWCV